MKKLCLLASCFQLLIMTPIFVSAQGDTATGIKWTTGLSWEQVKEKAKKENKYIFLDCFATWCGPCKMMDRDVYPNDAVGTFLNSAFISVRLQMDKTSKDNDNVKKWYYVADSINLRYGEGYPTFIFLTPDGIISYVDKGYKTSTEFIQTAQVGMKNDQKFIDPFPGYEKLVTEYKQGKKNYDQYISMIKATYKLGDMSFFKTLWNEYSEHMTQLAPENRYTKENIQLWAEAFPNVLLSSKKNPFWFFYNDRKIIDEVMNIKGYAERVVDKTIANEIVDSFFQTQPTGELMRGMKLATVGLYMTEDDDKTDYREADWVKLEKLILGKYNYDCAKRNVLQARLIWYIAHNNYTSFAKWYLKKLEQYPPDFSDLSERNKLNRNCFDFIFLRSCDKRILLSYCKWMKKSLETATKEGNENFNHIDTYACLLYKAGKKKEAITWEEKAVAISGTSDTYFLEVLSQMKNDQPTNFIRDIGKGAEWENISWIKWDGFIFPKAIFIKDQKGKAAPNVSVTLKRTGETIAPNGKAEGWAVFEKVSVGDVLVVTQNNQLQKEIVVGKSPLALTVTLRAK